MSLVGLTIVSMLLLLALFAPLLAPYPEDAAGAVHATSRFLPPSWPHPFGTNALGQDVLSLVLLGARVSLISAVSIVFLGALVGVLLGAVAGYVGGWVDEGLMRFTDLILILPGLILAMAVAAAMGAGIVNMVLALALSWWPGYARLTRGEVVAKKEELFVQSARALGASDTRILLLHILPNVMSPIVVKMSLDMGLAILAVASLGFIGIGVKPPTPEWGSLLSVSRGDLPDYWWEAIFPGLAIMVTVFGFNLLGDGLRDITDPKARR
jgi:peptide/nickel transport system permease protein